MINDYYKHIASFYDQKWKRYTQVTLDKVMQCLPDTVAHQTVLDYGCGTGTLIQRLLIAHPDMQQVIGYDPVEEMLQQAQKKLEQLPAHIQKKVILQSHKEFDAPFDIIVSTSVLHYLPQPISELRYLREILKKDGLLLLLDYTKDGWLARYFEWVIKRIDAAHQKAYWPSQIVEMVESAGFTIMNMEAFAITFFWQGMVLKASA